MLFSEEIIQWYCHNKRILPWRQTKDPYLIWLSEIILQQTRVAQGLPYYLQFAETFPTVDRLADADEDVVLRLWQGLGYYSRARNLHKAAKEVMTEFGGVFPSHYPSLLKLPGVGEYTAAAVASFAADEVHAVVDGNVFRVLARVWGLSEAINSTTGKRAFSQLANELLDKNQPALYNQAIMEFGAMLCKPKQPACDGCPFREVCYANKHGEIDRLPVKIKKSPSRKRYFNYFLIQQGESLLMNKRGAGDIWQHLHDFPLIESEKEVGIVELALHSALIHAFGSDVIFTFRSKEYKHILSHQTIFARFIVLEGVQINFDENPTWNYVLRKDLDKLAKSKLIVSFLDEFFLP